MAEVAGPAPVEGDPEDLSEDLGRTEGKDEKLLDQHTMRKMKETQRREKLMILSKRVKEVGNFAALSDEKALTETILGTKEMMSEAKREQDEAHDGSESEGARRPDQDRKKERGNKKPRSGDG